MKPVITLALGGARSGKSEFAERLASERLTSETLASETLASGTCADAARRDESGRFFGGAVYIATADAGDAEMASRIAAHKARRPSSWRTWEGDVRTLPDEVASVAGMGRVLLLDSLAMFVTRLFLDIPESDVDDDGRWAERERNILEETSKIFSGFVKAVEETPGEGRKYLIAVSDETGLGVVPPYRMGRRFRDVLGKANQLAAAAAGEAALIVAGLPLWLKKLPGDAI
jgi:adenosylcobinamide kinase/adenosylcobinamide-phosphate guanylyltransferase